MWKRILNCQQILFSVRQYSRISPPQPAYADPVIRVSNNIAQLGGPKEGPKPRQLLSLPPFPAHPLPRKNSFSIPGQSTRVTAISWVKYYFDEISDTVIQSHFNKGLVQIECPISEDSYVDKEGHMKPLRKIRPNEVMEAGARVYIPVSVAETRISKRFDTIPSGTLYPNADEIEYLQRLVKYKDSAIIVLNKPPRLPVKGNLPVHNSMDALAAAALSYDYDEGPKLVHRLDRESSGLLLMGRTKESVDHLQWLFSDINKANFSCEAWNDAYEATYQRYWALVIGCPKQKEGLIRAPLSKVLLNDGKTERVILAHQTGLEASQEAITEYRVLGPKINGCSWIELHPLTSRKHQCAAKAGVLSCFADLALTYPEDYYIEGQGSLLQCVLTPGDPYMPLPNEEIIARVAKQVLALFPSSQGLEVTWSSVVKIGQSLYREAPGKDPFRPDQKTPVKNFFLAGSYTKQDYIDSMEGATLSGRQASAFICDAGEELVALRKKLAAIESQENTKAANVTDELSLV